MEKDDDSNVVVHRHGMASHRIATVLNKPLFAECVSVGICDDVHASRLSGLSSI